MSRILRVPGPALAGLTLLCLGIVLAPAHAVQPESEEASATSGYVHALKSKDPQVRRQAALALGDLGTKGRPAMAALRQALLDADARVQSAAAAALQKLEDNHSANPTAEDADRTPERTERTERHAEDRDNTARSQARIDHLSAQLREEQARSRKLAEQLQVAQKREEEAARAAEKARSDAAAATDNDRDSKLKTAQALALQKSKDVADLRDQVTSLKLQIKTLTERNEQLARQLTEVHPPIPAPLPAPAPGPAPVTAPAPAPVGPRPPDQLSTTVRQVDPSGLVSIPLGTDNGVARGQQWQILRENPETREAPRLLGTMVIVNVDKREAVGRVERATDPVRVGDRVVGATPK